MAALTARILTKLMLLLPMLLILAFERASAHSQIPSYPHVYNNKASRYTGNGDPQTTRYVMIRESPDPRIPDKARCLAYNNCYLRDLTCPSQCPKRKLTKPKQSRGRSSSSSSTSNNNNKACFIDCSRKCQTSCAHRKPRCYGYAAVCYDPRFVGGDGIMFYFHGKAGEDFCLVTDPALHINARFIGLRPPGRTRDFTWVQAVAITFLDDEQKHRQLSLAARRVARWDPLQDQILLTHDAQPVSLPPGDGATWTSAAGDVSVERVAQANGVHVEIEGLMSLTVEVVPISGEEDRVHGYQLPPDDVFAHLNLQFDFYRLSASVDGVLGQTYRPGFQNPVKVGLPMPIMGGEARFRVSSLWATDCLAKQFASGADPDSAPRDGHLPLQDLNAKCTSTSTAGGIVCRR